MIPTNSMRAHDELEKLKRGYRIKLVLSGVLCVCLAILLVLSLIQSARLRQSNNFLIDKCIKLIQGVKK